MPTPITPANFTPSSPSGGFNYNWDSFLSGLGGAGMANVSQTFGHGGSSTPNYSLAPGKVNYSSMDIKDLLPSMTPQWEYKGGGKIQQKDVKGPDISQMFKGMAHDLMLQDQLNKVNFDRNQQAADMYLNKTMAAAEATKTASQPVWDKAYAFQQAGADQAAKDYTQFDKNLKAAAASMERTQNQVGGIYNQALSQVGEGMDRVASDAAAAINYKKKADMDLIRGGMGEFSGTEAQIDEAARRQGSSYDRDLFGTMANLQAQTSQQKAAILQNKGQVFASLGTSLAGMKQSSAQMLNSAAENKNQFNIFGAQIAMANAQVTQDVEKNFAQLTHLGYGTYAGVVKENPRLGVTLSSTLMAMAEAANKWGGINKQMYSPEETMYGSGLGNMNTTPVYKYSNGQVLTDQFGQHRGVLNSGQGIWT